jgi:ABC-type nitrate/sulfonate/bicarbonate transport system permease component
MATWIPLAIIFFSMIYNTVLGIQSIPMTLRRAVRSHGGGGLQLLAELIIPGALVQIILGLRTSVALGWRALVAAEMLAGTDGLGYMTMEAVQWYRTDTVIMGMLLVGILWIVIDRLLFLPLENATLVRWGIIQR